MLGTGLLTHRLLYLSLFATFRRKRIGFARQIASGYLDSRYPTDIATERMLTKSDIYSSNFCIGLQSDLKPICKLVRARLSLCNG